MPKNKLYNQSYFVKRLLDAGFFVKRLGIVFEEDDFRKWMIIVNDKNSNYNYNICITCFKYIENDTLKYTFKFQGQKEQEFILSTKSMNTIISILKDTFDERNENEQ
jgi:hypothetical protein